MSDEDIQRTDWRGQVPDILCVFMNAARSRHRAHLSSVLVVLAAAALFGCTANARPHATTGEGWRLIAITQQGPQVDDQTFTDQLSLDATLDDIGWGDEPAFTQIDFASEVVFLTRYEPGRLADFDGTSDRCNAVVHGVSSAGEGLLEIRFGTDPVGPTGCELAAHSSQLAFVLERNVFGDGPFAIGPSVSGHSSGKTSTTATGTVYNDGPINGTVIEIVGVRYDDVAHIRNQPRHAGETIATVAPLAVSPQVISSGGGISVGDNLWWGVTVDDQQGWVDADHVGQIVPASVVNLTESLLTEMPDKPAAGIDALVAEIGAALADSAAPLAVLSSEPPPTQTGTMQVTVDVVGLDDQRIKGWRIDLTYKAVFDESSDSQLVGVELLSAYGSAICQRNVDPDTNTCT